jgi:DNA-binding NtrC family response regulator
MERSRELILVAEDEQEIRINVVAAVKRCFPDFEVQEFADSITVARELRAVGESVFLVVTDMRMDMNDSGQFVAWKAEEKGVPHIVLHSTTAGFEKKMPQHTIRVKKALQPDDTKNLEVELKKLAS